MVQCVLALKKSDMKMNVSVRLSTFSGPLACWRAPGEQPGPRCVLTQARRAGQSSASEGVRRLSTRGQRLQLQWLVRWSKLFWNVRVWHRGISACVRTVHLGTVASAPHATCGRTSTHRPDTVLLYHPPPPSVINQATDSCHWNLISDQSPPAASSIGAFISRSFPPQEAKRQSCRPKVTCWCSQAEEFSLKRWSVLHNNVDLAGAEVMGV